MRTYRSRALLHYKQMGPLPPDADRKPIDLLLHQHQIEIKDMSDTINDLDPVNVIHAARIVKLGLLHTDKAQARNAKNSRTRNGRCQP